MKKLLIVGVAAIAAATSEGAAKDLPRLDSSKFDFCYEFVKSPAEEDLDGNGVGDMIINNASDNWLKCGTQYSIGYGDFDCSSANRFVGSNQGADAAGGVWRRYGVSSTTGFTIETRVQIRWDTAGSKGAISLTASANDSTVNAWLNIKDGSVKWGSSGSTVLTNMDTTVDYHTYRIARAPYSTTFTVWIDDNLVADGIGNAFSYGSVLNRILIGGLGGDFWGKGIVSHLRFTKGAYAPPIEKDMRRDSSEFEHKYEMDASDTRFSPTATASDWSLGSGEEGTATLSDGILSVVQPKGKMRYYQTVGTMDPSISAQSPFTFEIATRINSAWEGVTNGSVLNLFPGTPRASTAFYIGTNTVCDHNYTVVHTGDNTDKMHVFRITYKGEWPNSYTIYRDGEKIAENCGPYNPTAAYNFARFGVASTSTHGGAFDVDYVRWTTDGAFIPPKPRKGFAVGIK
ncbi:MAG: hypothetical protein IKE55_12435 [Kiritimatiellae bacterium]|nr:hypothetical protein [Kiritimatiellia bacterium]